MRPSVSLGLPSTMSSPLMLTSLISLYLRVGWGFSKLLSETIDDLPEESECRFNILDGVEAHTTSFSRLKS